MPTKKKPAKPPKKPIKPGTSQAAAAVRRKLFVEAYLTNGGNKTQAAIAAGYTPGGAERAAMRLSGDVRVLDMINTAQAKLFDTLEISRERILRERARQAFYNPRLLVHPDGRLKSLQELTPDMAHAIVGVEMKDGQPKYKLADRNPALTSLERQLGMYKADNEQQPAAPTFKDEIERARAIAFILAKASRNVSKEPRK